MPPSGSRGAELRHGHQCRPRHRSVPRGNFVFQALRETANSLRQQSGDERPRELRSTGAAMGLDEAAYALADIDPKLLTGPIASIDG